MSRGGRSAGRASVAGASIGLAITPFMTAVWAYDPGVVWDDLSLLVNVVGPTLESWGALSFGAARQVGADGTENRPAPSGKAGPGESCGLG